MAGPEVHAWSSGRSEDTRPGGERPTALGGITMCSDDRRCRGRPETFLVRAGEWEAVYGNMPPIGLGEATALVPLAESSTARLRVRKGVPSSARVDE
ncbi:MAG: hypothetical protein WCA90_07340 [Ilumatobacteraceae bacterium]